MRRSRRSRSPITGALAGLVATAAMSAHMLGRPSAESIGTPPPQRFAEALWPSESTGWRHAAAVVLHLAIGAGGGAVYGARRRRGPISGAFFGVLVWGIGYELAAPLIGVLPPTHRDRRDRRVALLQAHLIYGLVLGALAGSARR